MCASLGENPIIRFYRPTDNPHPARSHAARLAHFLQLDLDDYAENNPDFPPQSNTRPRSVLLLCERGFDVITPLLHEFTYQAMANDLMPIEDGKTYRFEPLMFLWLIVDTNFAVLRVLRRRTLL